MYLLTEVVVVDHGFDRGIIVDVLYVEVGAETPVLELPAFVDANVQLVK
jgi:hypothetical protein